jgi:hypothetical protein
MKTTLRLMILTCFAPLAVFADGSDNFNDNSKDTTKWGADVMGGLGVLTEQNQRLEFTCANPLSDLDTWRPWKLERFPVSSNWTVQVDTYNNTAPSLFSQVTSGGFTLFHPTNANSELYVELYAAPFGAPVNKGFDANLETDDANVGSADTGFLAGNTPVMGAIRMVYDGASKVATSFYDADTSDGYQWTELASYGLAGAGGTTANTDWSLSDGQQFTLYVYGYSAGMIVSSGELYLDNFTETGGAPPSGEPSPVPTGNFQFGFPTNNPLLTAIMNIAGNYSGMLPQADRPYTLDVAQDETGKLMVIGTVGGVTDSTGNPQLASDIGAVATVDGKPTVQSKGAFNYIVDGQSGSSKGTATIPLEIVDIGGGTNGVIGMATGSANALGVPLTFKSTPIAAPETPDMQTNFRKNWTLQLDISQNVVNGKQITVATALLTLPNGDVISYPEKKVKYSTTKGYKLSFAKGTNITVIPNRLDKKSKIKITGLTFVRQGDEWQPTAGTIGYQFLGQKGTANLLDFTGP